ncbi:MAG: FMN-binding protein, partial [Planctomycetota bacterium]|nr:FMN-binding protein [Planctomycetota bacterium]
AGVILLLIGPSLHADLLELLNGQRIKGQIVMAADGRVAIKISVGRGTVEMKYPMAKVHAVTVKGVRKVVNTKGSTRVSSTSSTRPPKKPTTGSRQTTSTKETTTTTTKTVPSTKDILKRIDAAGRSQPDWWDTVQMVNYPKSLDMKFPRPPKGSPWNTNKNISQYMWSVINENQSRWKGGAKFMMHVIDVNKSNPAGLVKAMDQMAHIYADLLEDYERGAFWLQQKAKRFGRSFSSGNAVKLANCYYRLGSRSLAEAVLRKSDSRNTGVIKLWGDMGNLTKALQSAGRLASAGRAHHAYMAAGDACRGNNQFKKAMTYYQKVLDLKVPQGKQAKRYDKVRGRAQASLQAIKLFETLDIAKVSDGTYRSSSIGYAGQVSIEVVVSNAKITKARVTQHREKQYYSSVVDTPRRIIAKNSVKGVDATTAATLTSEAIINATAKALSQGMKK